MPTRIMENIEQLIRTRNTCVLATSGDRGPHTSLMAYVAAPDCRTLYLATSRRTRKYENLVGNPGISLLVDTRCEDALQNVRALTICGVAEEVIDAEMRDAVRLQFVETHPALAVFMEIPDIAFISVSIHSFQLLSGVTQAHYVSVDESSPKLYPPGLKGDA